MGYELVLELGQKVGQLISKSEEKLWDIDIKNFTVSPLDQIKCIVSYIFSSHLKFHFWKVF